MLGIKSAGRTQQRMSRIAGGFGVVPEPEKQESYERYMREVMAAHRPAIATHPRQASLRLRIVPANREALNVPQPRTETVEVKVGNLPHQIRTARSAPANPYAVRRPVPIIQATPRTQELAAIIGCTHVSKRTSERLRKSPHRARQ